MFAFLIFDCTFAHLFTTKPRPRSSVEEKFDLSAYVLIFHRQRGRESKVLRNSLNKTLKLN